MKYNNKQSVREVSEGVFSIESIKPLFFHGLVTVVHKKLLIEPFLYLEGFAGL